MSAITISRQLGSRGARAARLLAADLGWTFVDKAVVNKVIQQYGLIHLDEFYGEKPPTLRQMWSSDSALTIDMMNRTIAAIAARGDVVILGRGGFAVLGDYADVLNVFVKAPLEIRVARIARRDKLEAEEAAVKVKADDKTRRSFTKAFYGADWAKADNFDLVINTKGLDDRAAVDAIIESLHGQPEPGPDAVLASELRIDPVLAHSVAEVIAAQRKR